MRNASAAGSGEVQRKPSCPGVPVSGDSRAVEEEWLEYCFLNYEEPWLPTLVDDQVVIRTVQG